MKASYLLTLCIFFCTANFSLSQSEEFAGIKIIEDIPYAGTTNPRQMLDLVLPTKRNGEILPVVAFIHGGGWRNGDRKRSVGKVVPLARSGNYVGVSIGYRLSGEAKWPSQIHDCKAAIRWIRANAGEYGIDPDKIAVWGSSAGGHLVSVLGTSDGVSEMDGSIGPYTDFSSKVACVIDFYGPTNFLTMQKTAIPGAKLNHDSPSSPESLLMGGAIQENPEKVATANPITYVTADDPPFLIVHGDKDPVVSFNQSELLHEALSEKGVPSILVTVENGGHGKGFGQDVNGIVNRFLEHHLLGRKSKWADQKVQSVNP